LSFGYNFHRGTTDSMIFFANVWSSKRKSLELVIQGISVHFVTSNRFYVGILKNFSFSQSRSLSPSLSRSLSSSSLSPLESATSSGWVTTTRPSPAPTSTWPSTATSSFRSNWIASLTQPQTARWNVSLLGS